jgi:RHS repeat-associated protein
MQKGGPPANKIDSTRSQTFTYDSLNRIATAAASTYATSPSHCWGESYTIDRYANLTAIGSISSAYTGCTQENLSITVSSNTNRITTSGFTYDLSGNLTSDGTHSPQYDAEGHMTSNAGVTYNYDFEGKRVQKSSGTLYSYGTSPDPLLETNGTGSLIKEYIFFGGKRIASRDSSNNVSYYLADHLGTARIVTNSSGAVQDDSDFYPYGGERVIASASGNRYKFTGKERDSESGLDNFGARYDSSQYGRFMTPDPLLNSGRPWDPQSWNRYAYRRNNPLRNVDPTGLYDLNNTCNDDDTKCNKQFEQHRADLKTGRSDLQAKVDKMKDGPEKQRLQASLKAFGTEGDHNGVNVTFGAVANGAAQTDPVNNQQTGQETYNVTMDPSKIGSTNAYGVDAAHEGTHISDISSELANPSLGVLSPFSLEYRAYQTSAYAASALGMGSISFNYDGRNSVIWNGSWGAVDRNITNFVTRFHDQNGQQTHPETTPHNPWAN